MHHSGKFAAFVGLAFISALPALSSSSAQSAVSDVAQGDPVQAFSKADLASDLALAFDAYTKLHPGLERHRSRDDIRSAWDDLIEDAPETLDQKTAFLLISDAAADIRDGHTYANFYNQPKDVREALFDGADKLPITFLIADDQVLITGDASQGETPLTGLQLVAVNGEPISTLLDRIDPLQKGDGDRPGVRRHDLNLSGLGRYEPFDIFQPLLNGPIEGLYELDLLTASGEPLSTTVAAMSRTDRAAALFPESQSDLPWTLEQRGDAAILTLSSFAMWNYDFNWSEWLSDAFDTLKKEGVSHLVIDIRGNGGGLSGPPAQLLSSLAVVDLPLPKQTEILAMQTVPEDLQGVAGTWDKSFYDWTNRSSPMGDGRFLHEPEDAMPEAIPANPGAYTGRVTLLIGPSNSSATFTLAKALKNAGRAVLVGQETGGSSRGITGGAMLFMTLPATGIEVDIPLIGYFPEDWDLAPDGGVTPDIEVVHTIEDIRADRDPALETALSLPD